MVKLDTSQYLDKWIQQEVSYNKRDLLLYAVGIGCNDLRYVYEYDPDFAAFPTYPIVLGFKGTDQDVVSFPSPTMLGGPPSPPLSGVKAGLDGERYIERVNSLDVDGGDLVLKSKLIGVHARGSGASVEGEQLLCDKNGKVLYKMSSGSFLVGAKDFQDSGRSNSEKVQLPNRPPDFVLDMPTSSTQTHVYRLSGDYNPLHIDPSMSQMMGFKQPILHGLCSLGVMVRAVIQKCCNNDEKLFKAVKARFASPVLPGEVLAVEMWKEGDKIICITKAKSTGKVVINNAYVLLHPRASL